MDFKQAGLEVIHAAKKEGLDHVDALIERTEELEVQIRDNKVEKVEQSTSLGLGIRVLNQGRSGFASTEKLDPQTIQKTLLKARSNSEFQDPTDVFMPDKTSAGLDENQLQLYQEELNQLNVEDLSRLGLETEAAARETDPRFQHTEWNILSVRTKLVPIVELCLKMEISENQDLNSGHNGNGILKQEENLVSGRWKKLRNFSEQAVLKAKNCLLFWMNIVLPGY